MTKLLTALLLLFTLSTCGQSGVLGPVVSQPADSDTAYVYVLIGQSNMQGIGLVSSLPGENPLQSELTGVKIWNHPGPNTGYGSASPAWRNYRAGYNQQQNLDSSYHYADGTRRYGPEGSFGYHLSQYLGKTIYIVKLGFGGATLGNSGAPALPAPYSGTAVWNKAAAKLYTIYFDEYLTPALAALTAQGKIPVVKGVFRWQGENDASGDYSSFGTNLAQHYTDLQTDLGVTPLKWIETRLHASITGYNSTGLAAVRTAQTDFVNADATNRSLLTVDECPMLDNVHVDGSESGQWLAGQKAAQIARYW